MIIIITCSHFAIFRQAMVTFAPLLAKSFAVSFPIPVFAPVTITTLLVAFNSLS